MKIKLFPATLLVILALASCALADNYAWTSFGANNHGTRNANDIGIRPTLSSANVKQIGIESVFNTELDGYISATPYVDNSVVIFPAADGYLYCLHRNPLILKWKVYIPNIQEQSGDRSRTTPVRYKNSIIFGHRVGAYISAVNYYTGEVEWSTQTHDHVAATITASPSLHNGVLYFGVSSLEEAFAADDMYPCCSFVGRFIAMSASDGTILLSFDTIDEDVLIGPGQYSGVAAWGSQPLIDEHRGSVLFGTGNTYTAPPDVQACGEDTPASFDCDYPGVYLNGVISLDINTFELNWYRRLSAYDAWTVACFFNGTNCPEVVGPDADFGMNGVFVEHVNTPYGTKDIIMIGQKSGVVWSLDAVTGEVLCNVSVAPGGTLGGLSWGAATDGKYFYASGINNANICHYIDYPVYGQTYAGSFSRVSLSTCAISWIIQNPSANSVGEDSPDYNAYHFGSFSVGPVSLVNDLVIGTDTSIRGSVVFIQQSSGEVVKVLDSGSTIYGGVAVYDNCIYYGNGYDPEFSPYFTEGNTFFEACVPRNGQVY